MYGHLNVKLCVFVSILKDIWHTVLLTDVLSSRPHGISSRDDSFTDPRLH